MRLRLAMRAALATLADIKGGAEGGRRIAVLGDMLELGEFSRVEHEKLATVARDNKVDALFLLGEHSKATGKKARDYDFIMAEHFDSFDALVPELQEFIQEHDVILVKGSRSMHMENVVNALHGEPA